MSKLKDQLKKGQAQYEDLSENIIAPEQQSIVASNDKSELNVVYNRYGENGNSYTISDGNHQVFVEAKTKLEIKKEYESYLNSLKENFSQPTTQEILAREDMDKDMKDIAVAYYEYGSNHIVIAEDEFLATGETIRKMVEAAGIIDCSKMSEDEIAQVEMAYQTIYLTSAISHEKKHRNNDELGCNKNNILPEFVAKLDMMDETSANLTQAAVALNNYRTTGRTEGFDLLWCCGNEAIDNIKKYVTDPQNKDKLTSEETKKFITEQVRDGWLKTNNKAGKTYSKQAFNKAGKALSATQTKFAPLSWLDGNSSQKEYETRVNKIFSNIPGMGDVSNYVNPNFELNQQLKDNILMSSPTPDHEVYKTPEMKAFFENAANGADNPVDAEANVVTSLEPIKMAMEKALIDDGKISPEEQQEIDVVTRETINRINSLRGTNKPNETAQSTETTQPTQTNTLPPFLASKGQNTL